MPFKRLLPKIFLAIGFLALFTAVACRRQIQEFFSFNLRKVKIHTDNFFYQSNSGLKRRKPIALLEKETELNLYVGEPFRSFNNKEWDEFWAIIYGAYPADAPEEQGLPRRVRQMGQDEIAYELARHYPEPFAYFTPDNWKAFFSIILKQNES
jgi:hypothetical protein